MKNEERTEDKVVGSMVGTAIGDALGVPVETMTHGEILAATGGAGVTDYIGQLQTRFHHQIDKSRTSDDTQLMLAVAWSLTKLGYFSQEDQAQALATAYLETTAGWGGSTKRGAERVLLENVLKVVGFDLSRDLIDTSEKARGLGNGVAMKIAPLALWHAHVDGMATANLSRNVLAIGQQTHSDPRASLAALAVALTINAVMHVSKSRFTKTAAHLLVGGPEVLGEIISLEKTLVDSLQEDAQISHRIKKMLSNLGSAQKLREATGTNCISTESIPFSLGVFLRHPDDFEAGVLEAVNAGGDTDSNAAMVGAMIGANVGYAGIPERFKQGLDRRTLRDVCFAARCLLARVKLTSQEQEADIDKAAK